MPTKANPNASMSKRAPLDVEDSSASDAEQRGEASDEDDNQDQDERSAPLQVHAGRPLKVRDGANLVSKRTQREQHDARARALQEKERRKSGAKEPLVAPSAPSDQEDEDEDEEEENSESEAEVVESHKAKTNDNGNRGGKPAARAPEKAASRKSNSRAVSREKEQTGNRRNSDKGKESSSRAGKAESDGAESSEDEVAVVAAPRDNVVSGHVRLHAEEGRADPLLP